ncbi:MAG: hypothetical protein E3J86_02545 [Candidatus Thorarchaeota archaeon]|nr:MAG: hypothetical protein E3J86_02545 [Candidatus Thorarchaeota archaeon]
MTNTEKDEMLLREMQGRAIVVDLDWSPEQYENQLPEEEEPILPDRVTLGCQVMACDCMREIEDMEDKSDYERMEWNQVTTYYSTILVPTKIHMVQGPTGNYPRFWGYICQFFPETGDVGVKKATISLPSDLSKRIAAFSEDILDMKANPLKDSTVHMILTTYHGLEEFEIDGEKRKAHKFWNTSIIEGRRFLE